MWSRLSSAVDPSDEALPCNDPSRARQEADKGETAFRDRRTFSETALARASPMTVFRRRYTEVESWGEQAV
jgi:hypothetical protein